MALRPVLRYPDPQLRQPTAPVEKVDESVRELVADMIETMIDANGAGLAAPQVHVPLRLVVFQAPESRSDPGLSEAERYDHTAPLTVLFNPEIEILSKEEEGGWEGCLSVPGLRGYVERPSRIRYRGLDANGKPLERTASGFHARVVQHEVDHLDGVLYPQRMRDLSKLIFESEAHHLAKRDE